MNFQKRGQIFISDSSFILLVVALKFGLCMYYFSNKKLAKLGRRKGRYGFFMIYLVLYNIVEKVMKKINLHL